MNEIIITARLREVLDTVKRIQGEGWPSFLTETRPAMRQAMRDIRTSNPILAASQMAKRASNEGLPYVALQILAVGVAMCEEGEGDGIGKAEPA